MIYTIIAVILAVIIMKTLQFYRCPVDQERI
ncbi:hypothetical protein FA11_0232 [Pelosinus fermentans A11]|nr:hypothetical protein FA11_0232 [Pelosinus fermentans A11]